jgi:arsenate reductase
MGLPDPLDSRHF